MRLPLPVLNGGGEGSTARGDVAAAAIVVNAIPHLARAKPGLRVMADLPPLHP